MTQVALIFGFCAAVILGIGLPLLGLSFLASKLNVWQDVDSSDF